MKDKKIRNGAVAKFIFATAPLGWKENSTDWTN